MTKTKTNAKAAATQVVATASATEKVNHAEQLKALEEKFAKAEADAKEAIRVLAEAKEKLEAQAAKDGTTITQLKQTNAGLQKDNASLLSENSKLKTENSELKYEIEALKIAEDLGSEEAKLTVDKKGVWSVKGHKYSFKDGITHVFIGGKKTPVTEALKNEAYLKGLAESKAIIIKRAD